jgi:hypothetical protein
MPNSAASEAVWPVRGWRPGAGIAAADADRSSVGHSSERSAASSARSQYHCHAHHALAPARRSALFLAAALDHRRKPARAGEAQDRRARTPDCHSSGHFGHGVAAGAAYTVLFPNNGIVGGAVRRLGLGRALFALDACSRRAGAGGPASSRTQSTHDRVPVAPSRRRGPGPRHRGRAHRGPARWAYLGAFPISLSQLDEVVSGP